MCWAALYRRPPILRGVSAIHLATFGLPTEYRGRDAIAAFFQSVLEIYPGFQFENTKVLINTPDQELMNGSSRFA